MDYLNKTVIGVIPLYDDEKDSIWMLNGYFDGLKAADAIPIMIPLNADKNEIEQINKFVDGWLFTGGHDVNPELYGETATKMCGKINKSRDFIEQTIFNIAFTEDKPILGICRGIQMINVLMGGTLYQDIKSEVSSDIEHHMSAPYDRVQHTVKISEGTPLYTLTQKDELGVNSYHHQAINRLAEGLEVMAKSNDGIIESVYAPKSKFLWAVQWHPEFSYLSDDNSMRIFNAFTKACKK